MRRRSVVQFWHIGCARSGHRTANSCGNILPHKRKNPSAAVEMVDGDEVDELLKAVDTSSGEINYTDLVRTILAN